MAAGHPAPHAPAPHALVAEFEAEAGLVAALRAVRSAGYARVEAYGPVPSDRVDAALAPERAMIAPFALACGLTGAAVAYAVQYASSVWDYPFLVGGKPYDSWPPFLVITFAVGLLSTVVGAFTAMLAANRLPRLHHPIFDLDSFAGASRDRWFLAVAGDDPRFDAEALRRLLRPQGPLSVHEVPS